MTPKTIPQVLDLALKIRESGGVFNPLFTGDAGIGKSEICQVWAKAQGPDFGFIDLRPAYREGPDFVGLPFVMKDENGKERSIFALPEFWPVGGKGLLLIEEPNRANQSVLNCMMQILTDRAIDKYKLPEGWVIASCINPDNAHYTVNSMDTALYNRFEEYPVNYDYKTFVEFIQTKQWHPSVVSFIKSGQWTYYPPAQIGDKGKYVSPRTFSKLNVAEQADLSNNIQLHYETSIGVLGEALGTQYHKYVFEITPVMAKDILENKEKAFEKLKGYCDVTQYRGDLVTVTIDSLTKEYGTTVDEKLIIEVAQILPGDQAVNLLKSLWMEKDLPSLNDLTVKYPELKDFLKKSLSRKANETKNNEMDKEEKKKK